MTFNVHNKLVKILTMLEKKFEKHQLQNDIGILAIKSEIKNLWNEIRDLSKSKLDIQNHPENFDSATKTSKITVDNDQNVLSNENIVLIKEFLNFKQNDMKVRGFLIFLLHEVLN